MTRTRRLHGFKMDINKFTNVILPSKFVAFQKAIALDLFKRIVLKTPVDKGFLRGGWTIAIGNPEPSQEKTSSGDSLTSEEYTEVINALSNLSPNELGQVVWINNTLPYVERIEFDHWSHTKAPLGMVQISLDELKTFMSNLPNPFKTKDGF